MKLNDFSTFLNTELFISDFMSFWLNKRLIINSYLSTAFFITVIKYLKLLFSIYDCILMVKLNIALNIFVYHKALLELLESFNNTRIMEVDCIALKWPLLRFKCQGNILGIWCK